MPLDAARSATKTDAITEAFTAIGRAPGASMLPATRSTKEKLALEYWCASVLSRLAEARRDRAKRAAVAGGVLPDIAADPYPVGAVETVYSGALVTIGVKVVAQADRVDVPGLVAFLEAKGVKGALLRRALKRHTESFAGAHIFTALPSV